MLHQPASTFQPSNTLPDLQNDDALLALGIKLETAVDDIRLAEGRSESDASDEANAIVEAAYASELTLLRQIAALPATTLAGLRVKARAVSRCHSDEPITDRFFCFTNDDPTTDLRLSAGILRDLLNL